MAAKNGETDFWARVDTSGDCWLWLGGQNQGRGRFRFEGRYAAVHRLAWELTYGPIPPGLCVCHHCDVGLCVRPTHLFLGTQADNLADMTAKGRRAQGFPPKLSWLERLSIQEIYAYEDISMKVLGERFGVNAATIHRVIHA